MSKRTKSKYRLSHKIVQTAVVDHGKISLYGQLRGSKPCTDIGERLVRRDERQCASTPDGTTQWYVTIPLTRSCVGWAQAMTRDKAVKRVFRAGEPFGRQDAARRGFIDQEYQLLGNTYDIGGLPAFATATASRATHSPDIIGRSDTARGHGTTRGLLAPRRTRITQTPRHIDATVDVLPIITTIDTSGNADDVQRVVRQTPCDVSVREVGQTRTTRRIYPYVAPLRQCQDHGAKGSV